MFDNVWGGRKNAKGVRQQHEKVEDRTNVSRTKVGNNENKKRHNSGR